MLEMIKTKKYDIEVKTADNKVERVRFFQPGTISTLLQYAIYRNETKPLYIYNSKGTVETIKTLSGLDDELAGYRLEALELKRSSMETDNSFSRD